MDGDWKEKMGKNNNDRESVLPFSFLFFLSGLFRVCICFSKRGQSLCENNTKKKRPEFSAAKRPLRIPLSLCLLNSLSPLSDPSFGRPTPPLRDAEKENAAGEEEEEEEEEGVVVPFDSSREEGRARERILCV